MERKAAGKGVYLRDGRHHVWKTCFGAGTVEMQVQPSPVCDGRWSLRLEKMAGSRYYHAHRHGELIGGAPFC
jgi:hypothetical protein